MPPMPETEQRLALLIATSVYSDPDLRQLRAPGRDASELAEVLRDPRIGGFDVQILSTPHRERSRRESRISALTGIPVINC